jgi:hypothetical protein
LVCFLGSGLGGMRTHGDPWLRARAFCCMDDGWMMGLVHVHVRTYIIHVRTCERARGGSPGCLLGRLFFL